MQSKPDKYVIKYWSIIDVKSSFILDLDVYLGKNQTQIRQVNVGETVVLTLTQKICS